MRKRAVPFFTLRDSSEICLPTPAPWKHETWNMEPRSKRTISTSSTKTRRHRGRGRGRGQRRVRRNNNNPHETNNQDPSSINNKDQEHLGYSSRSLLQKCTVSHPLQDGYVYVPKGDPYVTRHCKARSKNADKTIYVVYVRNLSFPVIYSFILGNAKESHSIAPLCWLTKVLELNWGEIYIYIYSYSGPLVSTTTRNPYPNRHSQIRPSDCITHSIRSCFCSPTPRRPLLNQGRTSTQYHFPVYAVSVPEKDSTTCL